MKVKKLLALLLVLAGVALLAAAGFLLGLNLAKSRAAAQSAARALRLLEQAPPPVTAPKADEADEAEPPSDPTDPPTLSWQLVEGHTYVGYLVLPSLDRTLPVLVPQYFEDLQIAPGLEAGSPHTDDAVISGHNYPSHFGPLRDWAGGEEVIFRDLEGREIAYTVTKVETIEATDVDKVIGTGHDLMLYTCTTGGEKRVIIACDRAAGSAGRQFRYQRGSVTHAS